MKSLSRIIANAVVNANGAIVYPIICATLESARPSRSIGGETELRAVGSSLEVRPGEKHRFHSNCTLLLSSTAGIRSRRTLRKVQANVGGNTMAPSAKQHICGLAEG